MVNRGADRVMLSLPVSGLQGGGADHVLLPLASEVSVVRASSDQVLLLGFMLYAEEAAHPRCRMP